MNRNNVNNTKNSADFSKFNNSTKYMSKLMQQENLDHKGFLDKTVKNKAPAEPTKKAAEVKND